ncbi:MAG: DUF1801 domain-containing protein [Chthoniobacterales bacterium]
MKTPAKVKTPRQYIASLPAEKRTTVQALHDAIQQAAPALAPHLYAGMLGYGSYHYIYASGREGDCAVVALASQKNYFSLYMCAVENGEYLVEKNKARLGKVSVGKSCIRFKKLEDLELEVALELVKKASRLK